MRTSITAVAAACLWLAAALPAHAAVLLLDRGLPTAHVNEDLVNPANGADRSNVAWYDGRYAAGDYWLLGDTITNTSGQNWNITSLRMWTVEPMAAGTPQLYGGKAGAASYSALASASSVTPGVTYANGDVYRDAFGSNSPLYQVDFTVNIALAAGETLVYLFDASWPLFDGPPALHASNAALSGSPQQGADDLMLAGRLVGGSVDIASVDPWTSLGNGWDKASDFNVQVIGDVAADQVPEPASLALAGLAMLGVTVSRRRRLG